MPTAIMTGATATTRVIKTRRELRAWREDLLGQPGAPTVGLVPTMGALHAGHLSLVEKARSSCDQVIVSIFVNPLQFGPNEDFAKYPRTFERDLELLSAAGVHAVFHPDVDAVYPGGGSRLTRVIPDESLTNRLCGQFRPGHFEGVATIVNILFNLVQPTHAFFGEKDFQQLTIIKKMVQDLCMPVDVVGAAIVREPDGLALSSRNLYLSDEQRLLAPELQRTLLSVRELILKGRAAGESKTEEQGEFKSQLKAGQTLGEGSGERSDERSSEASRAGERLLQMALQAGRDRLSKIDGLELQYLECCEPSDLSFKETVEFPLVLLIAAKLGEVRLIDNLVVE